jgi:3',5'-cyclic-AMP phosphodiesterase
MDKKQLYLWYTDTHLDKVAPWTLFSFIRRCMHDKPKGIFLTGDISSGILTIWHLKLLATFVKCPIYFVLGNHDYHFSSIEETHRRIRALCAKYPNLIWMTDADVIPLNEETCVIGTEGWYDAMLGNPKWLALTLDWMLTKEFRQLPNMPSRIEAFRDLADQSCGIIAHKLERALELGYKNIYLLTHFPPWKEATRDEGTLFSPYFLPYNVNLRLGQTIEQVMQDRKKRHVTVLAGHTHTDAWIQVARNIECKVNRAKYYYSLRNEEHIFI